MKSFFKICRNFARQSKEDNLSSYASSIAFFIFLSIIPMVMLLFAIIPYTPAKPDILIEWIYNEFPHQSADYFVSIVNEISGRSIGLISVTAITTLWAAGKGINSLIAAFNAIDKNTDKRNGILVRIISSLYTLMFLGAVIVILVIVVGGNVLKEFIIQHIPVASGVFSALVNFRSLISIGMMSFLFMICYSLLPYKKHKFRETFPGAILSSLVWTGFSYLFSFYIDKFNAFSMYGSLTTIIITLFWLYSCMYIMLIGCNMNRYFKPVIKTLGKKGVGIKDIKYQLESLEEE